MKVIDKKEIAGMARKERDMTIPKWLTDFLKDFASDIAGEFFGVHALKRMLKKGKEETEKKAKEAEEKKEPEAPKVKFGGIFDLSDEGAFYGLIGRLQGEYPEEGSRYAARISAHLNTLPQKWHRRRWRAAVGALTQFDYVKEEEAVKKEIPRKKGVPIKEEAKKTSYTNLGLEFLKGFARCTPAQMMEITMASGILDSPLDTLKAGLETTIAWVKENKEDLKASANKIGKGIGKSAEAVDKEFDNWGKWMDRNIHRKVRDTTFLGEWNWFLRPLLKKFKKNKKQNQKNRRGPSGSISSKFREIVLTIENRILARLARSR